MYARHLTSLALRLAFRLPVGKGVHNVLRRPASEKLLATARDLNVLFPRAVDITRSGNGEA